MLASALSINAANLWDAPTTDFTGGSVGITANSNFNLTLPAGFPRGQASIDYFKSLTTTNQADRGWVTLTTAKIIALNATNGIGGEAAAIAYLASCTNYDAGARAYANLQVYRLTGNQSAFVSTAQGILNSTTIDGSQKITVANAYCFYLAKTDPKGASDIALNVLASADKPKNLKDCEKLFKQVNILKSFGVGTPPQVDVQALVKWARSVKALQIPPSETYKDSISFLTMLQTAVMINDPSGIYK